MCEKLLKKKRRRHEEESGEKSRSNFNFFPTPTNLFFQKGSFAFAFNPTQSDSALQLITKPTLSLSSENRIVISRPHIREYGLLPISNANLGFSHLNLQPFPPPPLSASSTATTILRPAPHQNSSTFIPSIWNPHSSLENAAFPVVEERPSRGVIC